MNKDRIKRPAYQWYVADARNDEVYMLMTYEQRGIYRDLLDHQWVEGSIPADPALLAVLLHIDTERFRQVWPLIMGKFQPHRDTRLINAKLEAQRRELDEYIIEQREKGRVGGRRKADRLAAARAGLVADPKPDPTSSSSTSSSSTSTEQTNGSSATGAEPLTVLTYPTVGTNGTNWALTDAQVFEWQVAFPSIDIQAEARKALAWLHANPGRRKTALGMPKFLVNWLNRATDRGGGSGRSAAAAKPSRHAQWQSDGKADIADV